MSWRIQGWDEEDNSHIGPTKFDSYESASKAMKKSLDRGESMDGKEIIVAHVIPESEDDWLNEF